MLTSIYITLATEHHDEGHGHAAKHEGGGHGHDEGHGEKAHA
jgi:hypothetical protein